MPIRKALLATTMLAGIVGSACSIGVAHAADAAVPFYKAPPLPEPAVDGFNAKWEALGGALNKERLYGSRGAISIPLGRAVGLQIDGGLGSLGGSGFGTVAPHLFLRNPSQGLIGVYASYTQWNRFGGVHLAQVAGEAEHYFGRWTIQGIAGVEWGNSASTTTVSTFIVPQNGNIPGVNTTNFFTEGYDVRTRFFDQINVKYYFTDNVAGYIGHRYLGGQNALALGGETAVSLGRGLMASAFVEARLGEHAYNGVWGGLKFYFGQKDKTLMQRHRQDDPPIWDTLHSILNNYDSSSASSSQQFCEFGPPFNGSCEAF
jgi:hypothetical protein